ncbi:MAG: protein BatD [Verrucomicrobia bacterium]|nr:protein BatD [Verrucomicrobiota bacterium]
MVNVTDLYNLYIKRVWLALLLVCAASFVLGNSARAASFTATLDRHNVSVGESVNLSLIFQDGSPSTQPDIPTIPGIQVGGITASQNFQIVNGKSSAQVHYNYALIPTKEGEFTIPAITVKAGGQTLTSQPLKLTVTKAPVVTAKTADGTPPDAFVQLIVPKSEIYFGEVVPAEFRLYFQTMVQDVQLPEVSAEGFTMTPFNQRPDQSQVQLNGMTYNMAIFRFTISPAKTGMLKLGPARCRLAILSEPRRDFFGQTVFSKSRPANLVSEEVPIRVLPLPEQNKPATFSGAIGRFNMKMEAGPTELAVGDPITVRVQISGRGALESLKLPEQPAWRDFKSYTPSSTVETQDPLGLQGTKKFELVISPQNAGIKALPPFEFSFFDPEQKAYRTLSSQEVPLQVRPSALTPQPTIVSTGSSRADAIEAKEIVHIKPQLGTIRTSAPPLVTKPGFWIAQSLAPALWLGAMFYRRRKENLDKNPKLRRQKEVERIIQRDLQKLREHAAANKSDEFFATVFHLLQEQIGERLDTPPSGITEAVVDSELKPRGLNAESLALLHSLFQTCNQARYAPVRGSHELASHITKVEQALAELKKLKNEPVAVSV